MAARGGSSVPAHGYPPFDNSWTRYGRVLAPAVAWEQTSIQEPDVRYESGAFRMWAKGGWATSALGVYTSPDGLAWSRSGSNPVLGNGGSSWSPELSQPMILWDGTQYRCYFNSAGDTDPNTPLQTAAAIEWPRTPNAAS